MATAKFSRRRSARGSELPEPLRIVYEYRQFRYVLTDGNSNVLFPDLRIERPRAWQISPNCAWVITANRRVITGLRPLANLVYYGDFLFTSTGKKSLLFTRFEQQPDCAPNRLEIIVFPGYYVTNKKRIVSLLKMAFKDV